MLRDFSNHKAFLTRQDIWKMVKELYGRVQKENYYLTPYQHSFFAIVATLNGNWEMALKEFHHLDENKEGRTWMPWGTVVKLRQIALEHAPDAVPAKKEPAPPQGSKNLSEDPRNHQRILRHIGRDLRVPLTARVPSVCK
jgi:hypothetical protein